MSTQRCDDAVRGLIPTGWYPTAVALDPTGRAALHRQRLRIRIDRADVPPGAGPQLHGSRRRRLDSRRARTRGSSRASPSRCATTTTCCRRDDVKSASHDDDDRDDATTTDTRSARTANPIPMHPGRAARRSSTSSTSSRRTAPTIRCSATCRRATAIRRWCSSGATSRRITTRWPSSSRCSTTTTARATSRRSGTAGCLQAYPSTWVHKYGNARNNQNPMLLGPTDAIYDSAKAARPVGAGVRRARREHHHAVERHLDGHLQRLEERHHATSTSPRGRSSSACATSTTRRIRRPRAACPINTAPTSS